MAYLALVVAIGGSGSYALAAVSASNGTIAVCVDKGSGVMHLAKHQRCGRHQSRIGLSPALEATWAWAVRTKRRHNASVRACRSRTLGVGTYNVTVTAASCRHAQQERAGGERRRL